MMKKNIIYIVVIQAISTLILNCSGKNSYEDSRMIYDQAIEVHDEIMPRMDRIMQLQKALNNERENVMDTTLLLKIDSTIADLEESHDGMMQWMRNITPVPENGSENNSARVPGPEEMNKIQMKSLEAIREVKSDFNESIRHAEGLLEELQQ